MNIEKLNEHAYLFKEFIGYQDVVDIQSELLGHYNSHTLKCEADYPNADPHWMGIYKPCPEGIGDNMVFLSHVPKIHIAIKKALKPNFNIQLERINTNIQFKLQDSAFHTDGMFEGRTQFWTWTFVIFTSPAWDIQWGGEFCYMTPDHEYHYVPYIPGNAVLFNGWLDHKGNAPNLMSQAIRQSVAYTFMCPDPNVPII